MGKIRIIATRQVDADILMIDEVPSIRHAEETYVRKLRNLVEEQQATFIGRAVDEDSGVAYQLFNLPKDDGEQAVTILVEDRPATKILASLVDKGGQVRRVRVLG